MWGGIFFFLAIAHGMWDLSPQARDWPRPRQWQHSVLTTGRPGNFSQCGFDLHFSNNQWCWASFHVLIRYMYIFLLRNVYSNSLTIFFFFFKFWLLWVFLGAHGWAFSSLAHGSLAVVHGLICSETCGILVPWTGIEATSPAWRRILNHWTREVQLGLI